MTHFTIPGEDIQIRESAPQTVRVEVVPNLAKRTDALLPLILGLMLIVPTLNFVMARHVIGMGYLLLLPIFLAGGALFSLAVIKFLRRYYISIMEDRIKCAWTLPPTRQLALAKREVTYFTIQTMPFGFWESSSIRGYKVAPPWTVVFHLHDGRTLRLPLRISEQSVQSLSTVLARLIAHRTTAC